MKPNPLTKKATIIVEPYGDEFTVRMHCTGKNGQVDVSSEWHHYDTEGEALKAGVDWAKKIHYTAKIYTELLETIVVETFGDEPTPPKCSHPTILQSEDAKQWRCVRCNKPVSEEELGHRQPGGNAGSKDA